MCRPAPCRWGSQTWRVVTLLNQKGGVGKSTTTFHLGGALAKAGRRVLLVDNDPQASLTQVALGAVKALALPAEASLAAVYAGEARSSRGVDLATRFSWSRTPPKHRAFREIQPGRTLTFDPGPSKWPWSK